MKFSGKRLKELREGSGMTQKQLAAEVGTSERQLIRYEKGWPVPSDEMLQKMAGCLQKKVDDFFEVENSIPFFETLNHFISSGYKKDGLLYRAIQTTEKITFFFLNGDTTIPLFLQPLSYVLEETKQSLSLQKIFFCSMDLSPFQARFLEKAKYYEYIKHKDAVQRSKMKLKDFCESRGLEAFHKEQESILSQNFVFTDNYIFLRPFVMIIAPEQIPVLCVKKEHHIFEKYKEMYSDILGEEGYKRIN